MACCWLVFVGALGGVVVVVAVSGLQLEEALWEAALWQVVVFWRVVIPCGLGVSVASVQDVQVAVGAVAVSEKEAKRRRSHSHHVIPDAFSGLEVGAASSSLARACSVRVLGQSSL